MNPLESCSPLSRRRLLAAGATTVGVGLAGCGGSDEPTEDDRDPLVYVPAGTDLVVDVDMDIASSAETRALLETYADEDIGQRFEARTGLQTEPATSFLAFATDHQLDLGELLAFAIEPQLDGTTLVVEGEYAESDAIESLERAHDTDYERTDHDEATIFESDDSTAPSLGVAASDQYLLGADAVVRTALDVSAGEADAFEGSLREQFEADREEADDRTEYVVGSTDRTRELLPPDESLPAGVSLDVFEEVRTSTATYFVADGEVGVEFELHTPDEETTQEIADVTAAILLFLGTRAADAAVEAELDAIDVDAESETVMLTYRSTPERAATLLEWLAGLEL